LLDRVSSVVLGLNGGGGASVFADYTQWETWQAAQGEQASALEENLSQVQEISSKRKKLSYIEAREYATIEVRVADAEERLREKRDQLEDPTIGTDAVRLLQAQSELDEAQAAVDDLYVRWAELESKIS
jgi:ATP-binding cassette subfamily F protein uup